MNFFDSSKEDEFRYTRLTADKRHTSRQRYVAMFGSNVLKHQVFLRGDGSPGVHKSALVYGLVGGTRSTHHAHLTVDDGYVKNGSIHVTILYSLPGTTTRTHVYDEECSTSFTLDRVVPFSDGHRKTCPDDLIRQTNCVRLLDEFLGTKKCEFSAWRRTPADAAS